MLRAVSRRVFVPVPNVDSVLVGLTRTGPPAPAPLRAFVAGAFAHRRKALARSLALSRGADPTRVRAALVAITKQDLGAKPKSWRAWWEQHQDDDRIDWLFDGLAHRTPEIRAAAEQELRALTGEYFGYAFDLPRAAREAARARWIAWWRERPPKRPG